MDLDEFIKDVIASVYSGIDKAKKETGKDVVPSNFYSASDSVPCVSHAPDFSKLVIVSTIEFEVTLTNKDRDGVKAGVGVLLGTFNVGAKSSVEKEQSALSKAKFNVTIALD